MTVALTFEIREAIHDAKAKYFCFVDTKQWDKFGMVFTRDGVLEFPELRFSARGRDEVVAGVMAALGDAVTVHHGHMGAIEMIDETHARATWRWKTGSNADAAATHVDGYGHYTERYRLVEGVWRIEHSRLSRLHVESTKLAI